MFVKDIYCKNRNDNIHKAFILIFTYPTSRPIILDLVEDSSSKTITNSIKRFLARGGCPNPNHIR